MRIVSTGLVLFLALGLKAYSAVEKKEEPAGESANCGSQLQTRTFDSSQRRRTLNRMGYEGRRWDTVSAAFVDFARDPLCPRKVFLDVGSAFGRVVTAAARNGATVIANDIDGRHLEEMRAEMPPALRGNVLSYVGSFPADFEQTKFRFGAIRMSRVLHFFDGPTIVRALAQCFTMLEPGGKLFVVAATPYVGLFKNFIPTFERRVKEQASWPGIIEDIAELDPALLATYPKMVNLLDPDTLTQKFKAAGFEVESAKWLSNPDAPEGHAFDGRELVGIVGRKPL